MRRALTILTCCSLGGAAIAVASGLGLWMNRAGFKAPIDLEGNLAQVSDPERLRAAVSKVLEINQLLATDLLTFFLLILVILSLILVGISVGCYMLLRKLKGKREPAPSNP